MAQRRDGIQEMKFGSESARIRSEELSNEMERMLNALMKTMEPKLPQRNKR